MAANNVVATSNVVITGITKDRILALLPDNKVVTGISMDLIVTTIKLILDVDG